MSEWDGQVLTPYQIAMYARAIGVGNADLPFFVGAALAESSGRVDVTHDNSNGTTDYGLYQINSVHTQFHDFFPPSERWKDPAANTFSAFEVFKLQGRKAWSSSVSGQSGENAAAAAA